MPFRSESKKEEEEREEAVWFPHGLIGYPGPCRFNVVKGNEENPFVLLVSDDHGGLRLPMIDPLLIRPGYEVSLSAEEIDEMEIENRADVSLFVIVTLPEERGEATVNLRAPIVVSRVNRVGMQTLMADPALPVTAPLAKELEREEAEALL